MTDQISLSLDAINIGSSYARGNENNDHQAEAPYYLGPGEIGGYTVFNLGVEYRPLQALTLFAQVNNLLDREYYTGAQLGSTGFNADGEFVARPFAGPVVDGERPLLGSTFLAPGAPRTVLAGRQVLIRGRAETLKVARVSRQAAMATALSTACALNRHELASRRYTNMTSPTISRHGRRGMSVRKPHAATGWK